MTTLAALAKLVCFAAVFAAGLWALRRYGARPGAGGGAPLQVLGRASLGKNATVALVQVGDRAFTVGVAAQGVTLLAEVAPPAAPAPSQPDPTAPGRVPAPVAAQLQRVLEAALAAVRRGLPRLTAPAAPRPDAAGPAPAAAPAAAAPTTPEAAPAPKPAPRKTAARKTAAAHTAAPHTAAAAAPARKASPRKASPRKAAAPVPAAPGFADALEAAAAPAG